MANIRNIQTFMKRSLLAVAFVGTAMTAWAQEEPTYVAQIGEEKYETLRAAITAATDRQMVTLIANTTETETYTIQDKSITIDFGDYTVTANHSDGNAKVFNITSTGSLALKGTGGFTDGNVYGIFYNQGKLTVNGGNYSTTVDDYGVIVNDGGTCTVNAGTLKGAYSAIYTKGTNTVNVTSGTLNGASLGIQANAGTTLNVTGGTITATDQSKKFPGIQLKGDGTVATISNATVSGFNGIVVLEKASLTVKDGANISGKNLAITGNGNEGNGGTTITINGGTITNNDDVAIYHPQEGTLTITGGTITGTTALEVRSGIVIISGGTLTSNATEYSCNPNGNGTTTVGAAVAIAQHTTKKDISVTISGGEFTGVKSISESNPQNNDPAPLVTMSVTAGTFAGGLTVTDVQGGFIEGGTFSEAVPTEYCKSGKAPFVGEDGTCTIVTDDGTVNAEAQMDGIYYDKTEKAIENAGTTEAKTITLFKNLEGDNRSITIPAKANITLNVATGVTLSKPITNNGTLTTNGTISGDITIADALATVKIASGVTLPTVTLSTDLQSQNVLKTSDTKNSGYSTYWVEKTVKAMVDKSLTDDAKPTAETLIANTAINAVNGLTTNQSLTITVKSVTLDASSNVTKAEFEVKLIGADGQEITGTTPEITFHLPIPSSAAVGTWVNLWHNSTAITGTTVQGGDNSRYVEIKTTAFSTFKYEIINTPVAQIGETKFGTVNDAIKAATTAETEISLLSDAQAEISVPSDRNVKLIIGTHTISGTITNAGTLVIPENTGTLSGAISNSGTLTIVDGTISDAVSSSAGKLTISGGTFSNTITTSGTSALTISDGTVTGALTVSGSGTNTISGGTFTENVTTNAATTISGGVFAAEKTVKASEGTLTITGGTFEGTVTKDDTGTLAIAGGIFATVPAADYCSKGYMPLKNDAEKFEVKNEWSIVDNTDLTVNPHLENGNYTVAKATYHRNTGMVSAGNSKTQYGTICLPFAIKAAPTGMTLYRATSISGSTLTITAVDFTTAIPAGTPLIFGLGAAAYEMTVTSNDETNGIAVNTNAPATTPVTTTGSENLLVGTYTNTKMTNTGDLENIYYLNGDKFHQAKVELEVPAFRAYIKFASGTGAKSRTLAIKIEGGDATGIDNNMIDLNTFEEVYDMQGRKQNGLQKGMNIVRRADGSSIKIMVK